MCRLSSQEQWMQTLIVRLLKTHLFSLFHKFGGGGPPFSHPFPTPLFQMVHAAEEAVRLCCKRSSNDSNAHANLCVLKEHAREGLYCIMQAKSTSIFFYFILFSEVPGRASRYQFSNLEVGSTSSHAMPWGSKFLEI